MGTSGANFGHAAVVGRTGFGESGIIVHMESFSGCSACGNTVYPPSCSSRKRRHSAAAWMSAHFSMSARMSMMARFAGRCRGFSDMHSGLRERKAGYMHSDWELLIVAPLQV